MPWTYVPFTFVKGGPSEGNAWSVMCKEARGFDERTLLQSSSLSPGTSPPPAYRGVAETEGVEELRTETALLETLLEY